MKFFKNKKEKIIKCGECALFNRDKGICRVNIIINKEKVNIPCSEDDVCFFLEEANKDLGLIDEIQQVRIWEEDPEDPSGKKIVKIEYPENFFGD